MLDIYLPAEKTEILDLLYLKNTYFLVNLNKFLYSLYSYIDNHEILLN